MLTYPRIIFVLIFQILTIKSEITAVNKILLRYAHSQRNENNGKNQDNPKNVMMLKIMMGMFTGYMILYVISLLLPNTSNPEVIIFFIFKITHVFIYYRH